tara:strand:- start:458 stop:772 length:315 start_codon:yes stop_codon:yes gene_type:complete
MNEKEIKEKLEKLKEYEAQERKRKRWQPYVDMGNEIGQMYIHLNELETAAMHQEEAEDIGREYNLYLHIAGKACIWDAHLELEKQIEAKENEYVELEQRLTEEE